LVLFEQGTDYACDAIVPTFRFGRGLPQEFVCDAVSQATIKRGY
jgi:hypothetical protein